MPPDLSHDCIKHEGRISSLETETKISAGERRDQWDAINGLRQDLGEMNVNSRVTLQIVQQMAAEQKDLKTDIRSLTEAKALAEGERRRDAAFVGFFSAAASGIATYFVGHWVSGGK